MVAARQARPENQLTIPEGGSSQVEDGRRQTGQARESADYTWRRQQPGRRWSQPDRPGRASAGVTASPEVHQRGWGHTSLPTLADRCLVKGNMSPHCISLEAIEVDRTYWTHRRDMMLDFKKCSKIIFEFLIHQLTRNAFRDSAKRIPFGYRARRINGKANSRDRKASSGNTVGPPRKIIGQL
jgi:hypothetical protein